MPKKHPQKKNMCVFPKMIKWKGPAVVDDGGGLDGQGDEPHHVRHTN